MILGLKGIIGPIMSKVVFYCFLPIIMFNAFAKAKLGYEFYAIVALVIIYIAVGLLVSLIYARFRKLDPPTTASVVISSVFQNTAFMPFPIALALYGNIIPCAVYSFTLTTIHYPTIGVLAAIVDRKGNVLYNAVKKLITMPVIPAGFIGIACNMIGATKYFPQNIMEVIGFISVFGVYLSAIVVGTGLPHPKDVSRKIEDYIFFILGWRHILSILIHIILASLLISRSIWFKQVMLEAIMPPATGNTVVAFVYGFNVEAVAKSTVLSTVISLVQVTLLLLLGVL